MADKDYIKPLGISEHIRCYQIFVGISVLSEDKTLHTLKLQRCNICRIHVKFFAKSLPRTVRYGAKNGETTVRFDAFQSEDVWYNGCRDDFTLIVRSS